MLHHDQSPLADKTVKIKVGVEHPQVSDFAGSDFHVEDWWDRLTGRSWMNANGNPACLVYAMRTGFSSMNIPTDDEVLYGKIGPFGHLVHVLEIEVPVEAGMRPAVL